MKKNKVAKFLLNLSIVIVVLASILLGGYFAIDKIIVPKYFSEYGIYNMNDLVNIMKTLYTSPNEKNFITNPYTSYDTQNAVRKLANAGFHLKPGSTDELDYDAIAEGAGFTLNPDIDFVELNDCEIAGILNQMLASGVLGRYLPNLDYLNTINMEAREVVITPTITNHVLDPYSANISVVIKLDTSDVRSQMASYMDVPIFLLNMIVPETIYIESSMDVSIDEDQNWKHSNTFIYINGRTQEQSEKLLELLISFIFPVEEEMTLDKFSETMGELLEYGLKMMGDVQFTNAIATDNASSSTNGIHVTIKK